MLIKKQSQVFFSTTYMYWLCSGEPKAFEQKCSETRDVVRYGVGASLLVKLGHDCRMLSATEPM